VKFPVVARKDITLIARKTLARYTFVRDSCLDSRKLN
jgi:hypothetical protein